MENNIHELALFNVAIDSKLRGCDLVQLRVNDVMHNDKFFPEQLSFSKRRISQCVLKSQNSPVNHSKLKSTIRYLGVEVNDALEVSEHMEV